MTAPIGSATARQWGVETMRPSEPQLGPVDIAHLRFSGAICLAAALCFLVPALSLLMGVVYLPIFVLGTFAKERYAMEAAAKVVFGLAGVTAVVRLLYVVCKRREREPWRWLTLLGLTCGAAVAVFLWHEALAGRSPGGELYLLLVVYLPLAYTALLIYWSRRILFA